MTRPPNPMRKPANTKDTTHMSRRKNPSGTRRLLNIAFLSADREQAAIGPDVPTAVDERRGCQGRFADSVRAEQLERGAGLQHERLTLIIREKHFPVDRNGRCGKSFALRHAEPSLPQHFPCRSV